MAKVEAKRAAARTRTKSSKVYSDRARRSLPGGVTANVKYFDPYPIAMRRARGCHLWDLDGNQYIDYCLSFGPLILGHGHPRIVKALRDVLDSTGTTMLGTPHELEAAYAERLLRIFHPDGMMRFTVSGTEATLHAVRIARAYRRRPMIGKFEGHYHGGVDEVMSGFRVTYGGAQHAYGVVPDLVCLGKVIGGGLPCGAFLGRSEILELADPARDEFFHSSTFAGYPPAMAAGMATLDELEKPGTFEDLLETSRTVASGIRRVLSDHSAAVQVL